MNRSHPRGILPWSIACLIWVASGASGLRAADPKPAGGLQLHLRSRVEAFKGSGAWDEVQLEKEIRPEETAIVLCDVWDKHWCQGASERCAKLAERIEPVVSAARRRGIKIVHCPSETMDFYKESPARKRLLEVPLVKPEVTLELTDPKLPIDDSDGGCDTPEKFYKAWTRQHAAIQIHDEDVIADRGDQVYSYFRQQGIKHVIYMGVHTNMCVLGRTFAIRQMTRWGMHCILVRDLTDTMYDPQDEPRVTHDEGTELVVQHIEKFWCPSILSEDLLETSPRAAR